MFLLCVASGKRVIIEMEVLTHSVGRPCLMDIRMSGLPE